MRRWIILLLAVLALVAAADALTWQLITDQMLRGWGEFVAAKRAEGWRVAAAAPQISGFPRAARLRVDDVEMAHDAKPVAGGASFGAQTIDIEWSFLQPRDIVLRPGGAMHARLGAGPDIDITAASLSLRRALSHADLWLLGSAIQMTTPTGPVGVGALNVHVAQPDRAHPEATSLTLALDGIDLPPDSRLTMLSPHVDHIDFSVIRDGRALTVPTFTMAWGKLLLSGQGDVQLDAQDQPAGQARLRLSGALELLDSLTASGQIAARDAATAKTVLTLLQRPGADGKPAVELPLKLQNRLLTVGGFPVVKLPELHLPPLAPATQTLQ